MERLPIGPRALALAASVALVFSIPGPAAAGEPVGPRFDSIPKAVERGGDALVGGHLEPRAGGHTIKLERRDPGGSWSVAATDVTNDRGDVGFRLVDLKTTADYRLVWRDDAGRRLRSGTRTISVRADVTLWLSPPDVMQGRTTRLFGALRPARSGRRVVVEQRVAGDWRTIARPRAGDGTFSVSFGPRHHGRRLIRARFRGDDHNLGAAVQKLLMVYRRAPATWYGPGLYGNRTACGKRLSPDTLGVAHRTLPCGTKVSILYRGRTIAVPVIDRGPYTESADYDLTERTARRLRFRGTDRIGVVTGA